MNTSAKIETFYAKEHPYKGAIAILRNLAKQTELEENYKWGAPVYTIDNKNVLGIMAFKNHFGIWLFNGSFLKDSKKVLKNAQEGKTKAMRHWKFTSIDEIDKAVVLAYMQEAIENQKKGTVLVPEKSQQTVIPALLEDIFAKKPNLQTTFNNLSPYKQREYCEYIATAKQEKTKNARLEKIIPMIEKGVGLNDLYRS